MIETQIRLYAFAMHYCHMLLSDIDEERMSHQPAENINTPTWIMGHLAICTDYAAQMLGGPMECPKDWHKKFGSKSDPAALTQPVPGKSELVIAYDAGHARVTSLFAEADPTALIRPHTSALLAPTPIKSVGDLLGHLMTTHEMMHLGQLSMWRRLMGHAPMF